MVVLEEGTGERLVLGAGDNNLYIFDLETRALVSLLESHSGLIHSVDCGISESGSARLLASGSEDGSVKLWDQRKKEPVHSLQPSDQSDLVRPHCGRYIGAVGLSRDWLACGGGPRLALWHLRSLAPAATLPPEEQEVKVVLFHDEVIMVGGGGGVMYQASFSGEVTAEVTTSSRVTYSLALQQNPSILCVAGSSSWVDICAPNFNYRDATISFPTQSL